MSFPPISDRQFALLTALSLAAGAAACAAPADDDPSIVARYATSVGSELTFHDYGDGVAGVWHHGRLADGVPDEFPLTLVAPASIDTLYRQVFPDQVVPELQRRKRFREDYSGHTLRDHLGLNKASMQPPARRSLRFSPAC